MCVREGENARGDDFERACLNNSGCDKLRLLKRAASRYCCAASPPASTTPPIFSLFSLSFTLRARHSALRPPRLRAAAAAAAALTRACFRYRTLASLSVTRFTRSARSSSLCAGEIGKPQTRDALLGCLSLSVSHGAGSIGSLLRPVAPYGFCSGMRRVVISLDTLHGWMRSFLRCLCFALRPQQVRSGPIKRGRSEAAWYRNCAGHFSLSLFFFLSLFFSSNTIDSPRLASGCIMHCRAASRSL